MTGKFKHNDGILVNLLTVIHAGKSDVSKEYNGSVRALSEDMRHHRAGRTLSLCTGNSDNLVSVLV